MVLVQNCFQSNISWNRLTESKEWFHENLLKNHENMILCTYGFTKFNNFFLLAIAINFTENYYSQFSWNTLEFTEKRMAYNSILIFQNDREHKPVQPWALICDTLLSRNLKAGTIFQLRQGTEVSLLCEIHPLPHFSISEEVIDHRTNRFLLRQNSETPVWISFFFL